MKMTLTLLLLLQCPLVAFASSETSQLTTNSTLKKYRVLDPNTEFTVKGDINDDGISDIATFLGDPNYIKNGVENLKIVVLKGSKNDGYEYFISSSDIPGDERISYFLKIERQSIFLLADSNGDDCSHSSIAYQFKMRGSDLVLIGKEQSTYNYGDDKNFYINRKSINYLTGEALLSKKSNRIYKEAIVKFSVRAPVKIYDFDIRQENEKPEELRGSFEENIKIISH